MSESQGVGTMARKPAASEAADAFAAGLEAAVLQGLGAAIENAVQAQQQLYVTGQAAFTAAVARRLSGSAEPAEGTDEAGAAAAPEDPEDVRARLREALSLAAAGPGLDPAETTRTLMTAFAESLDLLAAVNAQQMMGYVRVLLALGFEYQGEELGPAAVKALEEVFDGEALAQVLAALAAERKAFPNDPAQAG